MTARNALVGLALLALLGLGAGPPARAADAPENVGAEREAPVSPAPPSGGGSRRWVVGRSPRVFEESRDAIATRVGMWLDGSFQDNDVPGEELSLALNHLNVHLDTRYRSWQFFVEAEYEDEAERSGFPADRDLELEQAYLRFTPSELLSARVGRFNTPFGFWMPVHWSILMDTIEEPIHVGRELLPEQQVGAGLNGRWFGGEIGGWDTQLDYALFAGVGGDTLNQDQVDDIGAGADLRLLLEDRHLVGVSVYRQTGEQAFDRTERSTMLYTELHLGRGWTFRSEYLHQRRDRRAGEPWKQDLEFVYGKLRWYFRSNAYLNYRLSYGDDEDQETLLTAHTVVQTVTLGVQPHSALRVKLEYSDHEFRSAGRRDFAFWGLSVGVLF